MHGKIVHQSGLSCLRDICVILDSINGKQWFSETVGNFTMERSAVRSSSLYATVSQSELSIC